MPDDKAFHEMRENVLEIKAKMDKLIDTTDLKITYLTEKVKRLEDNNMWLWRAVVGSIITGAIALLLYK